MVEIGGKPIIWHIMKIYSHHGIKDFVICLGYKGYLIKEYFANYFLHTADVTIDLDSNSMHVHRNWNEGWKITLVETGDETMTGGRLKRLTNWVDDGTFMMTYGDGVGTVDIDRLREFHRSHGRLATVTAVRPPARFGGLEFDGDLVRRFTEKPQIGEGWINGGFFVLEPEVLDYIDGDQTMWEREPLERLAEDGQLVAYKHEGFWQSMDTLRDVRLLERLWQSNQAPWKVWK